MSGGGIFSNFEKPKPITGEEYNQRLMKGQTNEQIRASQAGLFGGRDPSDAQWNQIVTQAGMASGRPLPGSAQFYQPIYQPQYQNYSMTNPMGVSQYGQGFGGYNPYVMQMQTPFNPYSGRYDYGMQTPFSMGPAYGMQAPFSMGPDYGMQANQPGGQFGQALGGSPSPTPLQQQQQPQANYGSSQPIFSRSAGMRGTPNVMMRRAEGGIASLMDNE